MIFHPLHLILMTKDTQDLLHSIETYQLMLYQQLNLLKSQLIVYSHFGMTQFVQQSWTIRMFSLLLTEIL